MQVVALFSFVLEDAMLAAAGVTPNTPGLLIHIQNGS